MENLTTSHSGASCWERCHVPSMLKILLRYSIGEGTIGLSPFPVTIKACWPNYPCVPSHFIHFIIISCSLPGYSWNIAVRVLYQSIAVQWYFLASYSLPCGMRVSSSFIEDQSVALGWHFHPGGGCCLQHIHHTYSCYFLESSSDDDEDDEDEDDNEEEEKKQPLKRSYYLREHKPRTQLFEVPIGNLFVFIIRTILILRKQMKYCKKTSVLELSILIHGSVQKSKVVCL